MANLLTISADDQQRLAQLLGKPVPNPNRPEFKEFMAALEQENPEHASEVMRSLQQVSVAHKKQQKKVASEENQRNLLERLFMREQPDGTKVPHKNKIIGLVAAGGVMLTMVAFGLFSLKPTENGIKTGVDGSSLVGKAGAPVDPTATDPNATAKPTIKPAPTGKPTTPPNSVAGMNPPKQTKPLDPNVVKVTKMDVTPPSQTTGSLGQQNPNPSFNRPNTSSNLWTNTTPSVNLGSTSQTTQVNSNRQNSNQGSTSSAPTGTRINTAPKTPPSKPAAFGSAGQQNSAGSNFQVLGQPKQEGIANQSSGITFTSNRVNSQPIAVQSASLPIQANLSVNSQVLPTNTNQGIGSSGSSISSSSIGTTTLANPSTAPKPNSTTNSSSALNVASTSSSGGSFAVPASSPRPNSPVGVGSVTSSSSSPKPSTTPISQNQAITTGRAASVNSSQPQTSSSTRISSGFGVVSVQASGSSSSVGSSSNNSSGIVVRSSTSSGFAVSGGSQNQAVASNSRSGFTVGGAPNAAAPTNAATPANATSQTNQTASTPVQNAIPGVPNANSSPAQSTPSSGTSSSTTAQTIGIKPLEALLPNLSIGSRIPAKLVLQLVAVEQGEAPIVAESVGLRCGDKECPKITWVGYAKLGPDRRVWALFNQAIVDADSDGISETYSLTASVVGADDLRVGLAAELTDEAPSLISDLLRGTIGALSDFLTSSLGAKTTTIIPGGGSQQSSSVPGLGSFFLGRLGDLFSIPSGTKALVKVAKVPVGTNIIVLYGVNAYGQPTNK